MKESGQGGASLPGAALCRYPSKVRAGCLNRACTDSCGGCEATRIPTATSRFRGLSCFTKAGLVDRRQKTIVCPTSAVTAQQLRVLPHKLVNSRKKWRRGRRILIPWQIGRAHV